jgi:hypothetical protein
MAFLPRALGWCVATSIFRVLANRHAKVRRAGWTPCGRGHLPDARAGENQYCGARKSGSLEIGPGNNRRTSSSLPFRNPSRCRYERRVRNWCTFGKMTYKQADKSTNYSRFGSSTAGSRCGSSSWGDSRREYIRSYRIRIDHIRSIRSGHNGHTRFANAYNDDSTCHGSDDSYSIGGFALNGRGHGRHGATWHGSRLSDGRPERPGPRWLPPGRLPARRPLRRTWTWETPLQ